MLGRRFWKENDSTACPKIGALLITLFHLVSNFNTLCHQFESGKTQKTAGRRLSVAIGNTKVTIVQIAITIIQV
jgi:hypothetical protein